MRRKLATPIRYFWASLVIASLATSVAPPARANVIAPVLLFAGAGTSANDSAALEAILKSGHIRYSIVSSSQLNGMTESQIFEYRLLIVPGGDFVKMGNSLTAGTTSNVRNAVKRGLNYLGICAGGFLAGSFPAPYKSFDLSSGVKFGFYSAEMNGIRKVAVRIRNADGAVFDHYLEDGPQLSGWGDVVGKYPDGTAAIVEGSFGRGRVILSGVHVEATERWRRGMAFVTPVSVDIAYARALIVTALNGASLPHY